MTATHADQLIGGYLARLRLAATDLPANVRDELIDDMRAHIAEARTRETEETDASILNILDRLGEPAVVVAEARERLGLRTPGSSRTGLVEIAAVVLLPFFWIIGVILLWWSPAWKVRDKIIGTVLSLGGYPIVLSFGTLASHSLLRPVFVSGCSSRASSNGDVIQTVCTGPSPAEVVGAIISVAAAVTLLLLPILTAVYLAVRLRWRPRMQAVTAH
jgi:uncharacterized membrane protein